MHRHPCLQLRRRCHKDDGSCQYPEDRITQAEYFFGSSDPGQGSATPLNVYDGQWDEAFERAFSTIEPGSIQGQSSFNVRAANKLGQWGSTFTKTVFFPQAPQPEIPQPPSIVYAEYFFGLYGGPEEGSATPCLPDGEWDEAVEEILRTNLTWFVPFGPALLNMRIQQRDGDWGPIFKKVVWPQGADTDANLIAQNDSLVICPGDTVTLVSWGPTRTSLCGRTEIPAFNGAPHPQFPLTSRSPRPTASLNWLILSSSRSFQRRKSRQTCQVTW